MHWLRTNSVVNLSLLLLPSSLACQHNFSHVNIVFLEPTFEFDPEVSIKARRTFAVIPNEELKGQQADIAEKQILYLVAVGLEQGGYEHVAVAESPDLLVTIGFSNEYN